jgi:hypothetical protein
MVLGRDIASMVHAPIKHCIPTSVAFADKRTSTIDEFYTGELRVKGYSRRLDFYVADIESDVIIGVPFLESIIIKDMVGRGAGRVRR